ncbi:MAG: hypothetical protein AB1Z17_10380 [Lutibacter sp.]
MNPFLIYSLIAVVFFIIGYTISYLISKNKSQKITSELEIKHKLLLEEKELNTTLIN